MKTVRVRIAVAVDPNGDWSAAGWSCADDETLFGNVADTLAPGEARYILEADLAVPEVQVVQAQVQRVEE